MEGFQNVGRVIPCKHLKTVLSRNTGYWKPRLCKRCPQILLHAMLETEISHRLNSLVTVTYITYQTSRPAMMTFARSHKLSMLSVSNYQFNYNHFEVKCETTFQIFPGAKQAEIMTWSLFTFLTEWSSGQQTMLRLFTLVIWFIGNFPKNNSVGYANHNPFFEATFVNEVQFQQVMISLEMVEESKGSCEKGDESRKVTRKGMRLVPVKLPDGTTRNFYGKDLFRISRTSYE